MPEFLQEQAFHLKKNDIIKHTEISNSSLGFVCLFGPFYGFDFMNLICFFFILKASFDILENSNTGRY